MTDRVDGDPAAVLNGLSNEVNYFREDKVDDLRGYFREEGFLDPRPTRPDERIRSAVVDAYCQHGLEPTARVIAADEILYRISAGPEPTESDD